MNERPARKGGPHPLDPEKFVVVDAAVALPDPLSASALRVYALLCSHRSSETGIAWPSQKRLAGILKVGIPVISRAVAELKGRNLLSIRRERRGGQWGSNYYSLPLDQKRMSRVVLGAMLDHRFVSTDLRFLVALGRWIGSELHTTHDSRPGGRLDQLAAAAEFLQLPRRTVRESARRLVERYALRSFPLPLLPEFDGGPPTSDNQEIADLVAAYRDNPDCGLAADIESSKYEIWVAINPQREQASPTPPGAHCLEDESVPDFLRETI